MNRKCVGMSRRRRPNAPPARLSEAAVFSRQFSHSRRDNLIGNISLNIIRLTRPVPCPGELHRVPRSK